MSDDAVEEGIDFYFPHELAGTTLEFEVAPQDPAAQQQEDDDNDPSGVRIYKKGVAEGDPWQKKTVGDEGALALDWLSQAVLAGDVTIEDSPFLFKGPPLPPAPPEPPQPPHKSLSASGKLGINFGKDKLTVTFALNGGGGASAAGGGGAGGGVGGAGGQGGAVTINVKNYSIQPVFEVGALLKSDETIIIALRCVLRYFYHWCDALNLAIDFLQKQAAGGGGDFVSEFVGVNWWMFVFSLFAMKDMLYDIVADEADFIAELLHKIGIEAKFDVNGAGNFDLEVGVDASGTVCGKAYLPLAVMLAPLIEFLMAGSNAPKPTGGSLADKIVPYVEGVVEDRVSIAVGGMPAAFMVEAKGVLCKGSFAVPQGSPLRAEIEKIGKGMFEAADHYKNNKLKTLPDETRLIRLILDLLDHEVRNMVKLVRAGQAAEQGDASAARAGADALNATVAAATPYVQQIMDALQGKPVDEPPGISDAAKSVIRVLAQTKVQGLTIGTVGPMEATASGDRKLVVLHVGDAEKARLADFHADPELETTTFTVALPQKPSAVAWNYLSHNPRLANDYSGIIAGFDDEGGRDACKQACRDRGWVPAELGEFEDQHPQDSQGLLWAWVAVDISSKLAARQLPMPEMTLTGDGSLKLCFGELASGAVPDALETEVPLLAGASVTREQIWKVTLMDGATGEEVEAIQEQVDRNQPDDNPYATALDDALDNLNGNSPPPPPSSPGGDKRFARLGRPIAAINRRR